MFNSSMMYPAMPVMAMNGNGNNNDGFGNGGWWAWLLMAMFWGWGGNGNWGWGNNGGSANVDASLQRGFDTQTIISKLDGINNGLCSLGYDQLAQMNGINSNIFQTGAGLQQSITQSQIADMQSFNALSRQFADCCCDQRAAIKDLQFNMATSDCSIKTLINQVAQQLQWGQQNGLRDLMDLINNKFCQLEMSQKDNLIADLRSQLNNCGRDNALQALYQQLINTLQPTAVPAYPSCNPRGVGNWAASVLSGNNNCGCGRNNCCNNDCCGCY